MPEPAASSAPQTPSPGSPPGGASRLWSVLTPPVIAGMVVLLGLFVAMYGLYPYCFGYGSIPVSLATICYALWTQEAYGNWGHCILVFPLFFVLLYLKREELGRVTARGSNSGLIVLALAMLCYWVGFKADVQYLGYISAQIFIAGVVIFLLGWRFFQAMLFPWMFITFAWPFLFLDNYIAFPLRVKMSALCYHFLNLIGVDTLQNGSALLSAPDFARNIAAGTRFQVDIADPCSGIRSLFALTMITALYGYLVLPRTWQKWTLFICAVPLAIAGNFVRIMILVFGTVQFGADFAIGSIDKPTWYHMGAGYFVYVVALGGMVGIAWLLDRQWQWTSKIADTAAAVAASTKKSDTPGERYEY